MNPTDFFLSQESKRYVNALQMSRQQVSRLDNLYHISALAKTPTGPAYLAAANPDIKREKNALIKAAEDRVKAIFDRDPTYSAAHKCSEATRGWSPGLAQHFHDTAQRMRRAEKQESEQEQSSAPKP